MTDNFSAANDEVLFVPLGGSGEIGGNFNLYQSRGKWLAVDCGVSFGQDAPPGIEVVMPDPAFIAERARNLVGLVITHGHEDHIGAIEHLWKDLRCPVYATPFTAALIRAKLGKSDGKAPVRLVEKNPGEVWELGPYKLEFVHVTHSIPDNAMLIIETPAGKILHTGDWKFDPDPLVGEASNLERLRELGESGVLAVVGDSTNAGIPGRGGSEAEVRLGLIDLVGQQKKGRVVITCFASNLARLKIAAEAARLAEREITLVGRSLWRILGAAQESGFWNGPEPLSPEDAAYLPAERALYVVTGSQGEPRSALSRLAENEHPELLLERGDTVIYSSREIPGNEKEIARVQNQLAQLGVKVITMNDMPAGAHIHVSGHPAQDELTELYQLVRPQMLIPVHGEPQHQQAHAAVGQACQISQYLIPANGDVLRLSRAGPEKIATVETGRLGVDGKQVVKLRGDVLRARGKIATVGAIVIGLAIDEAGQLAADPTLTLLGVGDDTAGDKLEDKLFDIIEDNFEKLKAADRQDDALVEAAISQAVRRYFNQSYGKKPVTKLQIARV